MSSEMITGKIIRSGTKLKVVFLKNGVSSNGTQWQFFSFNENRKNQATGKYDCLQQYTIFINNFQPNLKDGDYVTIKKINSIQTKISFWNGITYKKVALGCDVENINQGNNEPNFDNENEQQKNPFDNSFNVDYDFGF